MRLSRIDDDEEEDTFYQAKETKQATTRWDAFRDAAFDFFQRTKQDPRSSSSATGRRISTIRRRRMMTY
jgi:hypothetical protein